MALAGLGGMRHIAGTTESVRRYLNIFRTTLLSETLAEEIQSCGLSATLSLIFATDRFGHKAVVQVNISSTSAFGGKADVIWLNFQRYELPVSAQSRHTSL